MDKKSQSEIDEEPPFYIPRCLTEHDNELQQRDLIEEEQPF